MVPVKIHLTQNQILVLQRAATAASIITEIATAAIERAVSYMLYLNAASRVVSISCALQRRDYSRIVLDLTAACALFFFPGGWLLAVVADIWAEVLCSPEKAPPEQNDSSLLRMLQNGPKRDPTKQEEALVLLNVREDQANDFALIQRNYEKALNCLLPKVEKIPRIYRKMFNQLIEDYHTAYHTLTAGKIDDDPRAIAYKPTGGIDDID